MSSRTVQSVLALVLMILGAAPPALAGRPPEVETVAEARDPLTNGHLLILTGRGLKKIDAAELFDGQGGSAGTLSVVKPGNTILSMALPNGLEPGTYEMVLTYGRDAEGLSFDISIRAGGLLPGSVDRDALQEALQTDLDDAESLSGNPGSFYQDATNVNAGTLSTDRFDAFADLKDEGLVGEDDQWSTDHFSALDDLKVDGVFDDSEMLSTDHYSAWADLIAEGKVSGGLLSNSVFSAYDDLLAESKIGDGAGQVAAGNHSHPDLWLPIGGGTLTGPLTIDIAGAATGPLLTISETFTSTAPMVLLSNNTTGAGVTLRALTSGSHPSDPTKAAAIVGHHTGLTGNGAGVVGKSNAEFGWGVTGVGAIGVVGRSSSGIGVQAINKSGGTALLVDTRTDFGDAGGTAMKVRHAGATGNLLTGSSTAGLVARVDLAGKGFFNGGTATSGADFAESVAVAGDASEFEPGDVLVIDRRARRGFALSTQAESSLVAGVVSTKPALLGSVHDVAGGGLPDDEVPMGVVGIVPTKVTDENGSIRIGDLLVASSTPGHAMRAPDNPRVGTVLGKALDGLDEGAGLIEVLLTLR